MTRFHDQTLHSLIHISFAQDRCSVAVLRSAVRDFTLEYLTPAIERGWVELQTGRTGPSFARLTEAGEKWLRHLCDLSNDQPAKINLANG